MSDPAPITIDRAALSELLARATARWLGIEEAAAYSSLSAVSIRRLISAGKLQPRRPLKGKLLVDRLELDNLISSSTATPRIGRGRNRGQEVPDS